jgi:hypothetical protein
MSNSVGQRPMKWKLVLIISPERAKANEKDLRPFRAYGEGYRYHRALPCAIA